MTLLTLLANLSLSYLGLAALCLSMKRHHLAVLDAPVAPRRSLLLRVLGWMGIGLSFALAVNGDGWNFGPVQWIGSITCAGLLVVGVLSYRPRYLLPTTLIALPLTLFVTVSMG
jgi:hypothetical protein